MKLTYGIALAAIITVISVPFGVASAFVTQQQYQQYWCGSYYSYTPCQQTSYQPYTQYTPQYSQYSQPSYNSYTQPAAQYYPSQPYTQPSYQTPYATPYSYYSPGYGSNYGYGTGYTAPQQYYPQQQYQQPQYPQARYYPSYSGVGGSCDVGGNGLWSAQSPGQCQGYVNAYLNQGGY